MIIRPIKTRLITANSCSLLDLLDECITELPEKSVVAFAAKIASMCEGRVVPLGSTEKDELVKQEAQLYVPSNLNPYGVTLAVARNMLVASAGVDESNSNGHYVLWPSDPQKTVNEVRAHLGKKHGVKDLGVIMTDSTTRPFQWGTTGITIAYSGFEPIKSYIGTEDLFGRPFDYHTNSIRNGLAAAAVLVSGEGTERMPFVVLSELDFVDFVSHDPTPEELAAQNISLEEDVYAPMLKLMPWQKGDKA